MKTNNDCIHNTETVQLSQNACIYDMYSALRQLHHLQTVMIGLVMQRGVKKRSPSQFSGPQQLRKVSSNLFKIASVRATTDRQNENFWYTHFGTRES